MPSEMGRVRAEGGLGIEGERAFVEIGEFEVGSAGQDRFRDVGFSDLDAQIVVDDPMASVEEIVGGRDDNGVRPN